MIDLIEIALSGERYNFHTHTQFCDGHASMEKMCDAALENGFACLGFSPHSPIVCQSPCNMSRESVPEYFSELERLRESYPEICIAAGMEIDYLCPEYGPHVDYFQKLPLDYRIGSVHFVPDRDGVPVDCDGHAGRFRQYLRDMFGDDLRYVVETFFEQTLRMIERGGFDVLGHFDKIAANASVVDPDIETYGWYRSLVTDVISYAKSSDIIVEVNTKAFVDKKRLFPSERVLPEIVRSGCSLLVSSDAHYPEKIYSGIPETLQIINNLKTKE